MIIQQIRSGWPDDKRHVPIEIKEYFRYRHELSEHEGLVYKAHNVLIPPTLRSDTLKKLHRSHQGIEKTQRLVRQCIFWPGMNPQIDDMISKCGTCRQHRNSNTREPLQPHQLPKRPWQRIATDLFEWKGRQHLIIVDYYSRYPEIAELRNTKAKTVINKTKSIFSRQGIPEEIDSDNGPQYSSDEYKHFATDYGFTHTTISPRYPRSGGLHERTVQTVKNLLQNAMKTIKTHTSHCWITATHPLMALVPHRHS